MLNEMAAGEAADLLHVLRPFVASQPAWRAHTGGCA
jgi:hypothetical protein